MSAVGAHRQTRSGVARRGSPLTRWIRRAITASGVFGYIFLYAPIVILVVFSFNSSRFVSTWESFSFRWYGVLFEDAAMGNALKNSLIVATSTTLLSTVFGTMVALAHGAASIPREGSL